MSERLGTVLFADVSDSTKLYETAGDTAALAAITSCLAAMRRDQSLRSTRRYGSAPRSSSPTRTALR